MQKCAVLNLIYQQPRVCWEISVIHALNTYQANKLLTGLLNIFNWILARFADQSAINISLFLGKLLCIYCEVNYTSVFQKLPKNWVAKITRLQSTQSKRLKKQLNCLLYTSP